jgi:hypothetical protein
VLPEQAGHEEMVHLQVEAFLLSFEVEQRAAGDLPEHGLLILYFLLLGDEMGEVAHVLAGNRLIREAVRGRYLLLGLLAVVCPLRCVRRMGLWLLRAGLFAVLLLLLVL